MADNLTNLTLTDWLDDLTVRFLLNLPSSELSSVPRLCFQIEEAQWYYEDFLRPLYPSLPALPLRQFCLLLFQHCPLFANFTATQHLAAYEDFLAYKVRVPVRGAIMMNESMEKLVLVRGWKKGSAWSFPRGKINKDERDLDCAIREVDEECGFNIREAGLVPEGGDDGVKFLDVTMREQHIRLFVFRGVEEGTHFEPRTRKEIGGIGWYNVKDLPGWRKKGGSGEVAAGGAGGSKFYMVAPFLGPLKKWIAAQRRRDEEMVGQGEDVLVGGDEELMLGGEAETEEEVPAQEQEVVVPETEKDKSEMLRQLMGVGNGITGPTPHPQQQQQPPPQQQRVRDNPLLALLQGTSNGTAQASQRKPPPEQLRNFQPPPHQPQPELSHQRLPSMDYMYQPSIQHLQHNQPRNANPHTSTPSHNFNGYTQTPTWPPREEHQPPQQQPFTPHFAQNQHPQQQRGPPPFTPADARFAQFQQQSHWPQQQQQQLPFHAQQQGPPPREVVPSAEHLPMPKLNANAASLLEAFRQGGNGAVSEPKGGRETQLMNGSGGGRHQAALLNLFRPSTAAGKAAEGVVGGGHELEEKAGGDRRRERRPTLNEITRTLPPTPTETFPEAGFGSEREAEQARKPRRVLQSARGTDDNGGPVDAEVSQPSRTILQRPPQPKSDHEGQGRGQMPVFGPVARGARREERADRQMDRDQLRSPNGRDKHPPPNPTRHDERHNGRAEPPAAFTILPRPGSSQAKKVAVATATSPVRSERTGSSRDEAPQQRPVQVMSRPPPSVETWAGRYSEQTEKREQLLKLFGKQEQQQERQEIFTPAFDAASPPPTVRANEEDREMKEERRASLLNLFTPQHPSAQAATATPPPAPLLQPSHRSTMHAGEQRKAPTNTLLDLFNKPSTRPISSAGGALQSPGTPISPFVLGTPGGFVESGKGSLRSPAVAGDEGARTRDFLRGFLDGVGREGGRR